ILHSSVYLIFFRTGAFLHARRCVLPSLSFPAPPARSSSLSLFCFFFATSPFRRPRFSAFIVTADTLLGCALRFPCHPFLPLRFLSPLLPPAFAFFCISRLRCLRFPSALLYCSYI
ncbi:hypothetical protein, partial [Stomatobaculum longum]|uniref:hypothetical protein n=1 Tax=Stomatobaculum longum TaxID=796942 RepID=UPI0028E93195